ncbi:MAG: TlpA family protein disulfide reductase [Acidobacteriota bacterium]
MLPVQQDPASRPSGWRRATAVFLALLSGLVLTFGILYIISNDQMKAAAGPQGDVALISYKGEAVELKDHLVPGKYTVFDFYADWCVNCREIEPYLENLAVDHEDVALRKINIDHWGTPVVAQYGLTFIPYLQMYGPDGKLVADGSGSVLAELAQRF